MRKIIIIILVIVAFGAGIYFKDDAFRLYNNFNKGLQDFKKTDIGVLISQIGKEIFTPSPLNVGGTPKDVILLKSKIISETNLQRKNNGLPALAENKKLDEAAASKANDMFKNQYFEHVSPSGTDPGELVKSFGYEFIVAGENLILGNFASEKEVVDDWMASPGHRANILNSRYAEIGVAIVKGTYKGGTAWIGVQEFGAPLSLCQEPDNSLKNEIELRKSQLDVLSSQIDEIRSQIGNVSRRSGIYNELVRHYNNLIESYQSIADTAKDLISKYNSQVNNFNNCLQGIDR